MPRKKASTRQTEPKTPWVEIVPQPLKTTKHYTRCFQCDRFPLHDDKDPLEIIPVVYLVNPTYREDYQREEKGRLCENCLQHRLVQSADDYKKSIDLSIYFVHQRLEALRLLRDHDIRVPPEEIWISAAAEGLAGTGQELRDLTAATGLSREEVVRRLIAQAKPADLGSNVT